MTPKISIAVHAYGTYAALYRNLIEFAKTAAPDVEWAMMLPTSHHLSAASEVVAADRLLCLEDEQSRTRLKKSDPTQLAGYRGNIYADIETEKKVYKHRPGAEQVARAAEVYKIYRDFLARIKPTHLLLAHVETFDGKVLYAIAEELNIRVMAPVDLRSLAGTIFSATPDEALPEYITANENLSERARQFLSEFRTSPKSSWNPGLFALPAGDEPLPRYEKPLVRRTIDFAKRTVRNPSLFEPALLSTSLKYTFPRIREAIRGVRASRNKRQFDLATLNDIPGKFIYYPLQTTPESSINTPAPYYIDQMRAIDAIRFAMPSDYTLVVKEHWASLDIRPASFYRVLGRKAGVQIMHSGASSIDIIKRAQLTISVTGSATLEAFLLGRPSLVLGGCFFASYLGGICPIDQLPRRIRQAIDNPPGDEEILKALTEIYDVRYECLVRPADEPGYFSNRPENIRRMLESILNHIERSRAFAGKKKNVTESGFLSVGLNESARSKH